MCRCYVSPDGATIEREFRLVTHGLEIRGEFQHNARRKLFRLFAPITANPWAIMMRWGFAGRGGFNAPVETLASGADFRESWKRGRRCIIPALGFYEWHVNPDASEQPYYIHPDDQDVFGFAGLWARSSADANAVTECCSIITLPANRADLGNP